MFSIMPAPIFNDFAPSYHPAVHSPLSSSPIRAPPPSSPPQPLSPRDPNAFYSSQREIQSSPIRPSKSRFAARPTRPNPVVRSREASQQNRRSMFLKGVQQRADENRWERRGVEQKLLSTEWFNETQARKQAKWFDPDSLVTETDIADAERMHEDSFAQEQVPEDLEEHLDDMMMDALMQEEDAEFEALMSSDTLPQNPSPNEVVRPDSPFSSDDDDYDAIFMELAYQQQSTSSDDVEMS